MNIFHVLFSFKGRINRGQFWLGQLFPIVAVILTLVAMSGALLAAFAQAQAAQEGTVGTLIGALAGIGIWTLLLVILLVWTGLAITIKRLHDRNKSAIWILVLYAPSLLSIVTIPLSSSLSAVFSFLSLVTSVWWLVELGFLPGTEGPNRFDHDGVDFDETFGRRPERETEQFQSARAPTDAMAGARAAMDAALAGQQTIVTPSRSMPQRPATPPPIRPQPSGFGRKGLA
jgi:uncharacterized membrane protein YhaH (DUF805 family)